MDNFTENVWHRIRLLTGKVNIQKKINSFTIKQFLSLSSESWRNICPQDIEILGWFPEGSVLPQREKVPPHALVSHPSSDGVTIKMSYAVDVL